MLIRDLDCFFLSYDEPDADSNFNSLVASSSLPLRRIHGVKGFDAAHKAAANASTTERFITIDADTTEIDPNFWNINLPEHVLRSINTYHFKAFCPSTLLVYGNGSVKLWNKLTTLNMRSHESVRNGTSIEFHSEAHSVNLWNKYSTTQPSDWCLLRAAFREGFKFRTFERTNRKFISGWMLNGKESQADWFAAGYFASHRKLKIDINDLDKLKKLVHSPLDSTWVAGGRKLIRHLIHPGISFSNWENNSNPFAPDTGVVDFRINEF